MKKLSFITLLLSIFFALVCQAQHGVTVDKVICKVDNYIILKSDLEIAYQSYLSSGQTYKEGVKCQILRQLIIDKVLVAKAELDSVEVQPVMIEAELERRMLYFVEQAGGKEQLQKALGRSLEDLKGELREQVEEQMLIQRMRSDITTDSKVTPAQVKKYFNSFSKDSLPIFPVQYEAAQIVKYPSVTNAEKIRVKEKLIELKGQIERGEKTFGEVAKVHSEDLGSAARGGCYGFKKRGDFVPEYEGVIFKLKAGEISEPVETEYGFHIIKLIERQGERYKSCHILMNPKSSDLDIKETESFLDSIRLLVVNDSISFTQAAYRFSDDDATKASGGRFTSPVDGSYTVSGTDFGKLDYGAFRVIDTMTVAGSISKPLRFRTASDKDAVRLLYFIKKIPPHKADYVKDYQQLYQAALASQKNKVVDKWF